MTINSIKPDFGSFTLSQNNDPIITLHPAQCLDFFPFLSTITNILHIIFKKITPTNDPFCPGLYQAYLNQKSLSRCLIGMIPFFGNIIEIIYQIAIKVFNFTFSEKFEALNAVKTNPEAYRYIETCYQNDENITKEAVSKNGLLLRFADNDLRKKKHIIRAAITNNPEAFVYADSSIKEDKDFILNFLQIQIPYPRQFKLSSELVPYNVLIHMSDTLREDEDIALAIINHIDFDEMLVYLLDRSLSESKEVMLALVTKFPKCLKYASQQLQADQDLQKASHQTN